MRGAPAALSACSMPGAATEALNHDDLLWVTSAQTIPGLAHKPKVQLQLVTTSPRLEKQEQEGGARRKALELFSNIFLQFSTPCLFDQRCLPGQRHQ